MLARFRAAGVHLLFSALVVGLFLCLVYFIWYPYPYYIFHSTINATKLVLMVDLVLGPLLTFIIFNTRKPARELKRDIAMIIFVQLMALGWGAHITDSVRPLFAVYFNGEIQSITGVSIDDSGYDTSIKVPGIFDKPILVGIEMSADEYRASIKRQLKGLELGFIMQTSQYKNITGDFRKHMISRSLTRQQLSQSDDKKQLLENYLSRTQHKFENLLFYPVGAGPYDAVAILDRDTLEIVDTLDMYIKNTTEY